MAAQKLLQIISGRLTQVEASQSSVGDGDAGKIIALDAAGLLSASMLPMLSILANSYDNRGSLRSLSPSSGDFAIVDGLGLFVWYSGSTEPDDDESCFATASGRWLLECPHWDVVDTWQLPDDEARDDRDEDIESRWPGRVLFGTASCSITSIATLVQVSFTGSITGAAVGDRVIATPPNSLAAGISVFALVTSTNTVTIYLNNPSASTQTISTGTWALAVFKDI